MCNCVFHLQSGISDIHIYHNFIIEYFVWVINSLCYYLVCKYKTHKRCAYQVKQNCKWTTIADLEHDGILVQDDVSMK